MISPTFKASAVAALFALLVWPASAFTIAGNQVDMSGQYPDMPTWQVLRVERGDSLYGGCEAFVKAAQLPATTVQKCVVAVFKESRNKFPTKLKTESDFFLRTGELIPFPVHTGMQLKVAPAYEAAKQAAFAKQLLTSISNFKARLTTLEGEKRLTTDQVNSLINRALTKTANGQGDAFATLRSNLDAEINRLSAIKQTVAANTSAIDTLTWWNVGLSFGGAAILVFLLVGLVRQRKTRKDVQRLADVVGNEADKSGLTGRVMQTETEVGACHARVDTAEQAQADLTRWVGTVEDRVNHLEDTLTIILERDATGRFNALPGAEAAINNLAVGDCIRLSMKGAGSGAAVPKIELVRDTDSIGEPVLRLNGVAPGNDLFHPAMKDGKPFFSIIRLYRALDRIEKGGHVIGLGKLQVVGKAPLGNVA